MTRGARKIRKIDCDTIVTSKIFANGAEIELSSDISLLNDEIILSTQLSGHESIIQRHLTNEHICKIDFLDNRERKGAALIITIRSRKMWNNIWLKVTPETSKYLSLCSSRIILTIPIMNSDKDSIEKIRKRLITFCHVSTNNSPVVIFNDIFFSELKKFILPFNLKAISYNSFGNNKKEFIVIIRNDYSISKTCAKLIRYLRRMRKVENESNNDPHSFFKVIKNESMKTNYLENTIFGSKNVETNENYDIKFNGFGSLFGDEWLHCDVVDVYLNEWRRRMREVIDNPSHTYEIRFKIYNTLLYTRLVRGVKVSSLRKLRKIAYNKIQENAKKIAGEKIYYSSTILRSIFDFDVLVIPIHVDNHWISGIIYQPKNCLVENVNKSDDLEMMEDDTYTYILIFDSMINDLTLDKSCCDIVLKEYIVACYNTWKEKYSKTSCYLVESRIKIIGIQDLYQQHNDYDCGLFMLEFMRQVFINPKSLDRLIKNEPMTSVFPDFNVDICRNYLKTFVYSKVDLEKWIVLYEMEQFYMSQRYGIKYKRFRSRSVNLNDKWNIKKVSVRSKSCI
uniref:ULP_PROTEASE domain-containing protein n=1 Tax=Strongyloides venezuelensis TaxID=75913 RepID=A0A0K0EUW9_STRVS